MRNILIIGLLVALVAVVLTEGFMDGQRPDFFDDEVEEDSTGTEFPTVPTPEATTSAAAPVALTLALVAVPLAQLLRNF